MAKKSSRTTTDEELQKKLKSYAKNGEHSSNAGYAKLGEQKHATYENQQIQSGKASQKGANQVNGYYINTLKQQVNQKNQNAIDVAMNLAKNGANGNRFNETTTIRSGHVNNDRGNGFSFSIPKNTAPTKINTSGPITGATTRRIANNIINDYGRDPLNPVSSIVGNELLNTIPSQQKTSSIVDQRKQQKAENRAVANNAMAKIDNATLNEINNALKKNGGKAEYSVLTDMEYQAGNNEANTINAGNVVANILKKKGFSEEEADWYGQNWEQLNGITNAQSYENKRSAAVGRQNANAYSLAKEYINASKQEGYYSDLDYQNGLIPDEKPNKKSEIFNNLVNQTGMTTDEALKYIQYVGELEDQQNTEAMLNQMESEINAHPFLSGLKYTAQDIASFPIAGIGATMQSLEKQADPEAPVNTNSDYYRLQNRADLTKEAVSNNINNPVGKFAYGVATSLGEMGSTLLVGGALTKSLGLTGTAAKIAAEASTLTPFFGTSYSSTLKAAQDKGFSDDQAVKYATAAGLAEVVFEKIGLDQIIDTFISASAGNLAGRQLVKKLGLSALAEGSEEVMTDIVNYIADDKVNGAFADSAISIVKYMEQGMTESEARRKAENDFMMQLGEDFLAGATSGAIMGGAAKIAGKVNYNSMAKSINSNQNLQSVKQNLYDTAKNAPEGTTAREIADSKSIEEISDKELSKIIESEADLAGTEKDTEEFVTDIVNSLSDFTAEEKKETINTILTAMQTDSENVTEEQEQKLTETLAKNEKLTETYAKAVTGDNAANTRAVSNAITSVKDEKNKIADIKSGKTRGIAAVSVDGNTAKVTKVLNNGKVEVYDKANGVQTKDIGSIIFASQNAEYVVNYLSRESTMSPEVATQLASQYKSSIPAQTWTEGVRTAFLEGASNTGTIDSLLNNGKNAFAAVVPQNTLTMAYALGKEYANNVKTETENAPAKRLSQGQLLNTTSELEGKVDERTQSLASMVAMMTGNNVRFVDTISDGSEGYYDSNNREIVISIDHLNASGHMTATDLIQVLGHEGFGEYFQKVNSEGYDKVRKATIDLMEKVEGSAKTNATIKRIMDVYRSTVESGKTLEEASGELANNLIAEIMFSEDGAEDLADIINENFTGEERQSIFQAFINFINDLINDIKSLLDGRNTGISSMAEVEDLQKIRDLFKEEFTKGIRNDIELSQETASEAVNSITKSTGIEVDPVTSTAVQHSVDTRLIETYQKLGYKTYEEAVNDVAEKIAISLGAKKPKNNKFDAEWDAEVKKAKGWIEAENSLANIILSSEENKKYLTYESDSRYKSIKKNSDYPQGTFDVNNLCRKRDLFTKIFDAMQKEMPNRLYTANDIASIRQAMWDSNLEVACALCYVEDRRQQVGEIADTFIGMYKKALNSKEHVIKKLNYKGDEKPLVASKEQIKNYGLKGRAGDTVIAVNGKNKGKAVPATFFYAEDSYIPTQYDLTTYRGYKELTENHPSIAYAFENYNNSRGMQAARLVEGRAEYDREILKWSPSTVKSKNRKGGLRMYSFSDFEAIHLIDTVQVIMDAAAKGVHIQAYTKVPAFARLVSQTGIKLNRSLIPATSKSSKAYAYINGEFVKVQATDEGIATVDGVDYLAFDCIEGIDVTSKDFIDERNNNNIGNILIGINDKQIRLAMSNPFIDYIIPFHTGQSNKVLEKKGIGLWDNYKDFQEDKHIGEGSAKAVNIYNDLFYNKAYKDKIVDKDTFVECYLKECEKRHLEPRFSQFLIEIKDGKPVIADGYYKLLVDFKTFDTEGKIHLQENVRPEFDLEFMNEILMNDKERAKLMNVSDELVDLIKDKMQEVGTDTDVARSVDYGNDLYFDSTEDADMYYFVEDVKAGNVGKWETYTINNKITNKMHDDVMDILGIDITGYKNVFKYDAVEHIEADHGKKGSTDQSMTDSHDIAKAKYILENYDDAYKGKGSSGLKNKDNSLASSVVFEKKMDDDYYYVVEAIPDAKSKKMYLISMYKNKKDTYSHVTNANSPSRYTLSEHESEVSSDLNITPEDKKSSGIKYSVDYTKTQQEALAKGAMTWPNGKLKTYYHGTSAEFNSFDYEKAKSGNYGYGFYLSPMQSKAEDYGNRLIKAYVMTAQDRIATRNDHRITAEQVTNVLDKYGLTDDQREYIWMDEGSLEDYLNEVGDRMVITDIEKEIFKWTNANPEDVLKTFQSIFNYDGLVMNNETVIFDNKLIKSAEETTADNNGYNIPLDKRFDTSKNDIRYSIDYKIDEDAINMLMDGYSDNMSDLFMDESTEVGKVSKKAVSIIEEGMKSASKLNIDVDEKLVSKITNKILKDNNSKFDKKVLESNLKNVFAYIKDKDGKVSYDDLMSVMDEIARPVLEMSVQNTAEGFEDRQRVVDYLKSAKLKLDSGQMQEVKNTYGSYNNFRMQQGLMSTWNNNGTYLDDVWEELCDLSGGYLDISTNPNDQPTALLATLESLKGKEIGLLQGESLDEAARDLSIDIFREFFELQAGENIQSNKTLRAAYTQSVLELNKAKAELRKAYADNALKSKQQAMEDAAAVNRLASLDNIIAEVDMDIDRALGEGDMYLVEELKNQKKVYEDRIEKLKSENKAVREKLADVKLRNRNTRTQQMYDRRNKELKKRIQKNMDYLNSLLSNETEKKHVPVDMVSQVIDICKLVTPEQTNSKVLQQKLDRLNNLYNQYQSDGTFLEAKSGGFNGESTSFIDYDKNLSSKIAALSKVLGERKYTQLLSPELQEVLDITNAIKTQIKNANTLISNKKLKDAREASQKMMREVRESGGKTNAFNEKLDMYMTAHLNSYREFRKLSGYNDDGALMALWEQFDEGQLLSHQIEKEIDDIFNDVLDGKENQKMIKRLTSFKPEDMVDIGLKDADGNPVLVTRGMRLSLIMHTYNKSNLNHLLGDGIVIPDMKLLKAGKTSEAYSKGETYRLVDYAAFSNAMAIEDKAAKEEALMQLNNRAVAQLKTLESQLDEYEQKFLEDAKEMFWKYTGKMINKTSVKLNGYAKARVENYFPIKVDPDFTAKDFAALIQDGTIEGMGMLKGRVVSKKAILLEDISDVILRQTSNVAKYAGFAIPIRNINMVMNMTTRDENGNKRNLQQTITRSWGKNNTDYLKKLMQDIQGARHENSILLSSLRGNFAGATLNLNPVVALKQAASMPTAAAVLGWGPIAKAQKDIGKGFFMKQGIEELEKINPLLWYRNKGNSTEELGDIKSKKGFGEKITNVGALNWIQNMDSGTVRTLEYASMYYVDEKMKKGVKGYDKLTKGSQLYWQKVSEIFTKTVEDTQPNYTVLQKAAISRTESSLVKNLFMFKTQPLQNFGIMYDSLGEYSAKIRQNKKLKTEQSAEELKEARKKFAMALSSQIAAAVTYSALDVFVKALLLNRWWKYKDEDDKDKDGNTDEILWSEMLHAALVEGVISTALGGFIGGSEIYSFSKSIIKKETYYGLEVPVVEMVNDFTDSIKKIQEYSEKYRTAETTADQQKYRAKLISTSYSLAGQTASFFGIPFNNVKNIFDSIYRYAEGFANGNTLAQMGPETEMSQRQLIMEAYIKGDMTEYNRLLEETRSESTGKTMNITNDIKKAYLSGVITEKQAVDYLINNLKSIEDETGAKLKIEEWKYQEANPGETYDVNAKTEDLQKLLADRDWKNAKTEIKALQEKGISDKAIKDGIKNACLDEYKTLKKANKSANYVNELAKLMAQAGLYKSVDNASKAIQKWE